MTQPKNDDNHLSFSRNYEVIIPRDEPALGIISSDWQGLKNMVSHLISGSRWIEHMFNTFLAVFLSLIASLPSIERNNKYWMVYFSATLIFFTGAIFSLIMIFLIKKTDGSTKNDILAKMASIEEKCSVEKSTDKNKSEDEKIDKGELKTQKLSDQRQKGIEIPLERGGRFTLLSAIFQSDSDYWRAGVKLYSPNAALNENPLGENTALFHFAFGNNQAGLTIYTDGLAENRRHIDLPNIKAREPIALTIERNEKNFVFCYINDEILFNQRMSPELFSKAQFLTWGDGQQYEVELLNLHYEGITS